MPPLEYGGQLAVFADDTAIMFEGRVITAMVRKLQNGLDTLSSYYNNWKVRINAAKTQTIVFPHSKSPRLIPPANLKINMSGCSIDWSKEVVYLGLVLDSKLIFRSQVDKLVNQTNILIKSLYPLIARRSKLNLKNRLAVYKQVILPAIEYAAPVWKSCAKSHKIRLQRMQNKILKMVLNLPTHTRTLRVHQMAEMELLDDRLDRICNNFIIKCNNSNIDLVRNLF